MLYVIIRTCPRDDGIAKLCYESFKLANIDAQYSFLAEPGEYNYINKTGINIYYRSKVDNYGGQFGVKGFISGLKKYNFNDCDQVIISDSDIIVFKNFLSQISNFDHAGAGCNSNFKKKKIRHISGQMQIFNGTTINRLKQLSIRDIDYHVQNMVSDKISVADDTFNSYMTDLWNCKKIFLHKCWTHYKAYEYVDKDINLVVSELIKKIEG